MSSVSNNYQADYKSAIGTAVTGGLAWGAGQYIFNKRPFVDRNKNIQDAFIKTMEEALVGIKDKAALENIEYQKTLEKTIDSLTSKEALQNFLKTKKDEFMRITDENLKFINEEITKMGEKDGKDIIKGLFKSDGKYNKFYQETLEACYNEKGELVHESSKLTKEAFDALKKIINKERLKNALVSGGTFMGVCALSCCLFEFFLSRKRNKANK